MKLEVSVLPKPCDDPNYLFYTNAHPGILALAMQPKKGGKGPDDLEGVPFIVPGDRYNEVSPCRIDGPHKLIVALHHSASCITGTL